MLRSLRVVPVVHDVWHILGTVRNPSIDRTIYVNNPPQKISFLAICMEDIDTVNAGNSMLYFSNLL